MGLVSMETMAATMRSLARIILLLSGVAAGTQACAANVRGRDALDDFIQQQMDAHRLPGLSACVVVGDTPI